MENNCAERVESADKSQKLDAEIRQLISEKLGIGLERVVDNARFFDDFGVDSLGQVELVMELESKFGIEIPDEVTQRMTTVKAVVDYVSSEAKF